MTTTALLLAAALAPAPASFVVRNVRVFDDAQIQRAEQKHLNEELARLSFGD